MSLVEMFLKYIIDISHQCGLQLCIKIVPRIIIVMAKERVKIIIFSLVHEAPQCLNVVDLIHYDKMAICLLSTNYF